MKRSFNQMNGKTLFPLFGLGVLVASLAGCGDSTAVPEETVTPSIKKVNFTPRSDAGLPVTAGTGVPDFKKVVALNAPKFGPGRSDPFALTAAEKSFESQQESERVFASSGGFSVQVEAKPEVPPVIEVEPQPYRRLSGIVVGDSVLAIIEMGDGRPPEIIRPGQRIPNSEWRVVSIDQDKAVLRRAGNKLPKEITVRLETPPPGYGPSNPFGGGATPPGGGFSPPGAPGGFPPGGPGGAED